MTFPEFRDRCNECGEWCKRVIDWSEVPCSRRLDRINQLETTCIEMNRRGFDVDGAESGTWWTIGTDFGELCVSAGEFDHQFGADERCGACLYHDDGEYTERDFPNLAAFLEWFDAGGTFLDPAIEAAIDDRLGETRANTYC